MVIDDNMRQDERAELYGRLVDAVEDFLEEKGFTPKDFPNDDREGGEDEAIIFGEDFDNLADRFAEVIGIPRYCDYITGENKGRQPRTYENGPIASYPLEYADNYLSVRNYPEDKKQDIQKVVNFYERGLITAPEATRMIADITRPE